MVAAETPGQGPANSLLFRRQRNAGSSLPFAPLPESNSEVRDDGNAPRAVRFKEAFGDRELMRRYSASTEKINNLKWSLAKSVANSVNYSCVWFQRTMER